MAERQRPLHIRVVLYAGEQTVYLFCDANFILTNDVMEELRRNAEASPDFVEGIRIFFRENPDSQVVTEFTYVVSFNREVGDDEAESLLSQLLGDKDFGERWLMSDHELLPRQRQLVQRHQSGTLDDDPTI